LPFVPVAIGTATVAPATTGALPSAAAPTRAFPVSSLMNREIYNLRGNWVGDIERVLMGEGNKLFVVVGHGGFLELGEKQVLIPMERIQVRDDRLVVQGYTDEQIRAMPEFRFDQARGYRELERTYNADLALYRG
jgi:sporulation protein YlmC with PRC-barrel domain